MAISYQTYTGNGSVTTFPISFDWIYASDVVVTVDGFTRVKGTDYTIVNKNVVFTTAPSPATLVRVARSSNLISRNVDFVNGSRLDESDLDNSAKQLFYLIQEIKDQTDDLETQIQSAAAALISPNSVNNSALQADAVTLSKIANGAVSPAKLSAGGPSWTEAGVLSASSFVGPLIGNVTGNVSGSSGSCTGNAATATRLASAPAFSAFQTSGAGQALTAATWVKVNLASEEFDTDNLFNTTLSRFAPTIAGWYQINGSVGATTSVSLQVGIAKNWTSGAPPTGSKLGGYGTAFAQEVSSVIYLNGTTDYVELLAYAATAATSNAGAVNTYLNGSLIKAA